MEGTRARLVRPVVLLALVTAVLLAFFLLAGPSSALPATAVALLS